jgi:hypothetical protein
VYSRRRRAIPIVEPSRQLGRISSVPMQILRLVVVVGFLALCATATGAPSPDPYTASLAYAKCLRAHGVPHPLPDAKGNFSLTPAEEQRLQSVPRKTRKAAENACFHYLKGLNLKPLSPQALARATAVVAELGRCIRGHGFTVGEPEVKNLSRGRAFFGFKAAPRPAYSSAQQKLLVSVQHACEKQVDMAARISKIIDEDRDNGRARL